MLHCMLMLYPKVPIPTTGVPTGGVPTADDDLSQSTPPLEGTSSATASYSRPYALERTPIIQVTKLPHSASSGVHTPAKMTVTPVIVGRGRQTRQSGRRQVEYEGKRVRGGEGGCEARCDGSEMEEWMCETPPLREEGEGGTDMQQRVPGEVVERLCEGVEREVGEVVEGNEGACKWPENTSQTLHTHSSEDMEGIENTSVLTEASLGQHETTLEGNGRSV